MISWMRFFLFRVGCIRGVGMIDGLVDWLGMLVVIFFMCVCIYVFTDMCIYEIILIMSGYMLKLCFKFFSFLYSLIFCTFNVEWTSSSGQVIN